MLMINVNAIASVGSGAGGGSLVPPEVRAEELARMDVTDANRKQLGEEWQEVLACLSKAKLAALKGIQDEFAHLLVERWFDLMSTKSSTRLADAGANSDLARVLWLEQCPFSECSFQGFLQALEMNANFADSEYYAALTAEEKEQVGTVWCLRMAKGTLDGDQMVRLVRAVQKHGKVGELFLEGNHVGDQAICRVAEALQEGHSLHILNLGGNGVADTGATALSAMLKEFPEGCLKKLFLMENRISDAGAREFAAALIINRSLQELNLERNVIEEPGINELRDASRDHQCTVCFGADCGDGANGEDPTHEEGTIRTGELDRPEVGPSNHPGGDTDKAAFRPFHIPTDWPSSRPPQS